MNVGQAARVIADVYTEGHLREVPREAVPVWLWGQPGIGKSACIPLAAKLIASELKLPSMGVIDLRAALLDPTDFRGFPFIKDGRTEWAAPCFWPSMESPHGILFVDELAQANAMVQAACLQPACGHRVGEYDLPKGWMFIAASNRKEDGAGVGRVITPLLDRFLHLEIDPDLDCWMQWASTADIHPSIIKFLRFRTEFFAQFSPTTTEKAQPSPRSWEMLSRVLPFTGKHQQYEVFSGLVGKACARELVGFLSAEGGMPDMGEILRCPESAPLPASTAGSVNIALSEALIEAAKRDDNAAMAAATYAVRLPEEVAMMTLPAILAATVAPLKVPSVLDWFVLHRAAVKS